MVQVSNHRKMVLHSAPCGRCTSRARKQKSLLPLRPELGSPRMSCSLHLVGKASCKAKHQFKGRGNRLQFLMGVLVSAD